MSDSFDKLADGISSVLNIVPDIYDDGLKPAVTEFGKTLALILQSVNAALVPLRKWIAQKEYSLEETKKLLIAKLENVDPEKITTPDAYVAVPALQAISYCMDNEELRNLYANLLAKAMNSDTAYSVHPSFTEIIKQMSPLDADIFKLILSRYAQPLLQLRIKTKDNEYTETVYNITWIEKYDHINVSIGINNLVRLGLIEIPFDTSYTIDAHYNIIRKTKHYNEIKQSLALKNLGEVEEIKQLIKLTDLGNLFYKVCVSDEMFIS